jgi:hypothetical protein
MLLSILATELLGKPEAAVNAIIPIGRIIFNELIESGLSASHDAVVTVFKALLNFFVVDPPPTPAPTPNPLPF